MTIDPTYRNHLLELKRYDLVARLDACTAAWARTERLARVTHPNSTAFAQAMIQTKVELAIVPLHDNDRFLTALETGTRRLLKLIGEAVSARN